MIKKFLLLALCVLLAPLASGSAAPAPAPSAEGDLWSRTRDGAEVWWERSVETADEWWQRSREGAEAVWEDTRGLLESSETDHFQRIWDRLLPKLEKTLELEERQDGLPPRAWIGPDRTSNQEAISALLDEAVDILSGSDLQGLRGRIRTLQSEIAAARADIAEYRRERVTAPSESLLRRTASDLERAIAAREADIARMQEELAAVEAQFAQGLRDLGLELEDGQVEALLSTVVGDNLVDLGVVFDNVRAVTLQLEGLVAESGEDVESARRYYGMYVVLLKALDHMHRTVEEAISGHYLPRIDAIVERTRALSAETRVLADASPDKADLLEANLEAQRLTLRAAGVYRRYLVEQGQQVRAARVALAADIAAAWNTYETVRVSGELIALVKSSRRLLQGLLDRQVPALRTFESLEMRRELDNLTAQLRGSAEI